MQCSGHVLNLPGWSPGAYLGGRLEMCASQSPLDTVCVEFHRLAPWLHKAVPWLHRDQRLWTFHRHSPGPARPSVTLTCPFPARPACRCEGLHAAPVGSPPPSVIYPLLSLEGVRRWWCCTVPECCCSWLQPSCPRVCVCVHVRVSCSVVFPHHGTKGGVFVVKTQRGMKNTLCCFYAAAQNQLSPRRLYSCSSSGSWWRLDSRPSVDWFPARNRLGKQADSPEPCVSWDCGRKSTLVGEKTKSRQNHPHILLKFLNEL